MARFHRSPGLSGSGDDTHSENEDLKRGKIEIEKFSQKKGEKTIWDRIFFLQNRKKKLEIEKGKR